MIYNEYGHQIYQEHDLIHLLYSGDSIDDCICESSSEITQFIQTTIEMGGTPNISIYQQPNQSPEEFHKPYVSKYNIPDYYKEFDIVDYVLSKIDEHDFDYNKDLAYDRAQTELVMFLEYGLEDYLRAIIYLLEEMNDKQIIRGCGRGSSVASFVLFVIGLHYVDPIKYNINISEFFRK